jgi:hypothetical protein
LARVARPRACGPRRFVVPSSFELSMDGQSLADP